MADETARAGADRGKIVDRETLLESIEAEAATRAAYVAKHPREPDPRSLRQVVLDTLPPYCSDDEAMELSRPYREFTELESENWLLRTRCAVDDVHPIKWCWGRPIVLGENSWRLAKLYRDNARRPVDFFTVA